MVQRRARHGLIQIQSHLPGRRPAPRRLWRYQVTRTTTDQDARMRDQQSAQRSYRVSPDQAPHAIVDRDASVDVEIDGNPIQALRGDTVASALLATGSRSAANSMYWNRPRGVFS